eukprot:g5104.t1
MPLVPETDSETLPNVFPGKYAATHSLVTEPYTIREFRGNYHMHKIHSKHPIPGTQLRVEQGREKWRKYHQEQMQVAVKKRIKEEKQNRSLRMKTQAILQNMRQNYGVGKIFRRITEIVDARSTEVQRMISSSQLQDPILTKRFWRAVKKADIHQINDLATQHQFDGINLQKDNGETALVEAVRKRDIFFTEGLLKMDSNPNVKDHAGRPVFLMPWSKFEMNPKLKSEEIRKEGQYIIEMSLLLLAHNADINCQRFDGNTSLHLATRYKIINLVIALIRFGADPYIKNVDEENVFDYAKKFKRHEISRIVANYKHVSGDMKIDEFFRKWKDFIFDEEKRQSLSITPGVDSLLLDFENTDRAVQGNIGKGIRIVAMKDTDDSGPSLKKSAHKSEAEMALKLWRNKKLDAKEVRAREAHALRPSINRMNIYKNLKIKKNCDIVKGILDDKKVATKAMLRRKSVVYNVINDVSKKNSTFDALRCRPATASLVFSRGTHAVPPAPPTDPNLMRKQQEDIKRKETFELLGAGNRKEATVNPPSILPPSIYNSKKNGPRLHVNNKVLDNPWEAFVSETKEDYERRMKLLPLHGQTLIRRR